MQNERKTRANKSNNCDLIERVFLFFIVFFSGGELFLRGQAEIGSSSERLVPEKKKARWVLQDASFVGGWESFRAGGFRGS